MLPVDGDGLVDPATLAAALDADTVLVSVMAANNETGALQPIPELAALAHHHGALLHCDAAQAAGKIPLDVTALGADLLVALGAAAELAAADLAAGILTRIAPLRDGLHRKLATALPGRVHRNGPAQRRLPNTLNEIDRAARLLSAAASARAHRPSATT